MSSRKSERDQPALCCQKREVKKEKKKNFFDKDWADKHAASDKVSSNKQYEFEEGQDLEEAAIEGFLRP